MTRAEKEGEGKRERERKRQLERRKHKHGPPTLVLLRKGSKAQFKDCLSNHQHPSS